VGKLKRRIVGLFYSAVFRVTPVTIKSILTNKIRSKMYSGAAMLVTAVRAIENRYGKEGVEVIHCAFRERAIQIGKEKVEMVS